MNVRSVTLTSFVIIAALLLVLAQIGAWSVWLRLLLMVTLALCAAAIWFLVPRNEPRSRGDRPSVTTVFQEVQVTEVALPSSLRDYTFTFSATIRWRRLRNSAHANPAALAIENITEQARAIVSSEMPGTVSALSLQLNVALGVPRPDRSGEVEAMASEVSLTLPSEDVQRLEQMAEIHKQEALWAEQRRYEKNRREYLGEDVLKSPGSAVVWWLATKEEGVDQAAALIDTLARLSAVANDDASMDSEFIRKANGGGHVAADATAADCLENLMARMNLAADSDEGITFVDRVANDMEKADRSEHAEEIRHRFGIHTSWEELEGVDEESMQEESDLDSH